MDPIETGECEGSFTRYVYNQEKQICQEFQVGGCSSSRNKFETMEICEKTCIEKKTVKNDLAKFFPVYI